MRGIQALGAIMSWRVWDFLLYVCVRVDLSIFQYMNVSIRCLPPPPTTHPHPHMYPQWQQKLCGILNAAMHRLRRRRRMYTQLRSATVDIPQNLFLSVCVAVAVGGGAGGGAAFIDCCCCSCTHHPSVHSANPASVAEARARQMTQCGVASALPAPTEGH